MLGAQSELIQNVLHRLQTLEGEKQRAQDLFIRKSEWEILYRWDAWGFVDNQSRRLEGVVAVDNQVATLHTRVDNLEFQL